MINNPPGSEWYKNPTILIVGGIALFAGFILLRNQNSAAPSQSATPTNLGQATTLTSNGQTQTGPVGGTYSYLDGSGQEHIIATDPNGNLASYAALPPSTSMPQAGQLSSAVGNMSGWGIVLPYGGTTPYYGLPPEGIYQAN